MQVKQFLINILFCCAWVVGYAQSIIKASNYGVRSNSRNNTATGIRNAIKVRIQNNRVEQNGMLQVNATKMKKDDLEADCKMSLHE